MMLFWETFSGKGSSVAHSPKYIPEFVCLCVSAINAYMTCPCFCSVTMHMVIMEIILPYHYSILVYKVCAGTFTYSIRKNQKGKNVH